MEIRHKTCLEPYCSPPSLASRPDNNHKAVFEDCSDIAILVTWHIVSAAGPRIGITDFGLPSSKSFARSCLCWYETSECSYFEKAARAHSRPAAHSSELRVRNNSNSTKYACSESFDSQPVWPSAYHYPCLSCQTVADSKRNSPSSSASRSTLIQRWASEQLQARRPSDPSPGG